MDGVTVEPANLVEGTAATVHVTLVNNGSFDTTLWIIAVNDTVSGSAPLTVGSQESALVPTHGTVTVSFPWVPGRGVHTLAARAEAREGNSTIPLPPSTARVQVNKAPISEPRTVLGAIAVLLGVVLAIAMLPALLERPSKPRAPAARGQAPYDTGAEDRRGGR